ncbi:hypothetical protein BKA66DRAFT_576048 [Pyrenochaeta sp. MPI-SDFR-AT-0127]|nr:hypothetical protein BKA66DRAFT_576048 [Pyrenochaeta sp. MPI-SDFR-AT-0127]
MREGLEVIRKFKAFGKYRTEPQLALPSWVVDWRLVSQHFQRCEIKSRSEPVCRLQEVQFNQSYHKQFKDDNSKSTISFTKLVLQGVIDERYYPKGNSIWKKGTLIDKAIWNLDFDMQPKDLIIYFLPCLDPGISVSQAVRWNMNKGSHWVIRPLSGDADTEFELKACLPWVWEEYVPFHEHWEHRPNGEAVSSQVHKEQEYRRLAIPNRRNIIKEADAIDNSLVAAGKAQLSLKSLHPQDPQWNDIRKFIIA